MNVRDAVREHKELPLSLLDAPAIDLRMGRDEDKLAEIVASIQRHGILQPLVVVRDGTRFEIVDGFTRFLCAGRAGLVVVPCYIYPTRTAALEGVKYDTATMRLDLTPAEEATYFDELLRTVCAQDIEAVAARVGRSVSYVDARLQLIQGDDDVFDAVRAEKISLGVAQLLNTIPDEGWRRYYLTHAIRGGVTVSVMRGWVTEWRNTHAGQEHIPQPATPAVPIVAAPAHDPNQCVVCRKSDPRFIPRLVPIHDHCALAILEPMLAAYHGGDAGSS